MTSLIASIGRGIIYGLKSTGMGTMLMLRTLYNLRYIWRMRGEVLEQMRVVVVGSLPLVIVTSVFVGAVTAVQAVYQMQAYVPMKFLGSVISKSVFIELGPVLMALVVGSRLCANCAAVLGTMKVTEQLDAMNIMAIDPVRYLAMPRFVAAGEYAQLYGQQISIELSQQGKEFLGGHAAADIRAFKQGIGQVAFSGVQFNNLFLDGAFHDKAVHSDRTLLANAVGPVRGLVFNRRVPPRVHVDHVIGRGQVQARATSLEADKKQIALPGLKSGNPFPALGGTGLTIQVLIGNLFPVEIFPDQGQVADKLAEDQGPVALLLQGHQAAIGKQPPPPNAGPCPTPSRSPSSTTAWSEAPPRTICRERARARNDPSGLRAGIRA